MKRRYARFCAILSLSLLLGLPLRETGYSVSVFGVLSVALLFTAASASGATRRVRRLHFAGVAPIMIVSIMITFFGAHDGLAFFGEMIMVAFLSFTAIEIFTRLVKQEQVTADTVLGGICVYLLIGFAFSNLYTAIELAIPGSFLEFGSRLVPPVNSHYLLNRRPELSYYSFVTLTTVGYGDIVPALPLARVLSVFEALIGQIYLATFLAFLVGNFISDRDRTQSSGE